VALHSQEPIMDPNPIPPGSAGVAESNCSFLPKPFPDDPRYLLDVENRGQSLTLRHVRQLSNGAAFAAAEGHPLTALVTIHLRLAERFRPEDWAAFQTRLLDKMSRWLQRQRLPVAFAWVREDGPRKGPHLHLLLHLPYSHWGVFHRYLIFAGRFQFSDKGGKAIVITGGRFGMLVERMQAGALRYCLKSLDASANTFTALGLRPYSTNPVPLKRCGVSATIGRKARKEAGWIERTSFPDLAAQLHPANDNVAEAARHAA
jgi:hypothetical protein